MKRKSESYNYQKTRQLENEYQLITLLQNEGPKRFNELKRLTSRAPRGLHITLDTLKQRKQIEQYVDEKSGKVFYRATPKARRYFQDIFTLPFTLSWIEKENGKFYSDYSGFHGDMWFCYLPWGIRDDLALSKEIEEKNNPITKEFVKELQLYFFKKLRAEIRLKNIVLEPEKRGTIVLGFEIDYQDLIKSLKHKDVLKIRENVTVPELDIFERLQTGKEKPEDLKKFRSIMELRKS